MNFLQLAQKLRQKVGGTGTGPATVVAQTGEYLDFVDWTNEAWLAIQTLEANWKWMRKDFSFQTTAGKSFYLPNATAGETGITDLAKYHDDDTWRAYKTATGRADESFLVPWHYQTYRDSFDFGLQSTILSKPTVWSVRDRDRAVLLGHTPDDVYTITGQYQKVPTEMAADADEPDMPARFHMLVVYRAMMLYGKYEGAPEVFADGEEEFNKLYAALRIDQLEPVTLGEPLA